jgi:hypothetical protein
VVKKIPSMFKKWLQKSMGILVDNLEGGKRPLYPTIE